MVQIRQDICSGSFLQFSSRFFFNQLTIKDSFTFHSDLYMTSLYVDALFTNITLDGTIDICVKKLFKTLETLFKGISKMIFVIY